MWNRAQATWFPTPSFVPARGQLVKGRPEAQLRPVGRVFERQFPLCVRWLFPGIQEVMLCGLEVMRVDGVQPEGERSEGARQCNANAQDSAKPAVRGE